MVQQLVEVQKQTQETVLTSQRYEQQMIDLTHKVAQLEMLLVDQRQKGNRLESALSAAQDRIGGSERRAQRLEEENAKIHSELQSWHDWYNEDPKTEQQDVISSAQSNVGIPVSNVSLSQPSIATPSFVSFSSVLDGMSAAVSAPISMPMSTLVMSTPSGILGNIGRFDYLGNFTPATSLPLGGIPENEITPSFIRQQSGHRDSFGSVFPGSSGTGGNGNGAGNTTEMTGNTQQHMMNQQATFNIGIKPKEPPVFHGRANEDVDTWLAKVGDFIYLTEANDRQQVAYMATLLQDAAADWWASLLKERHGERPADFLEMTVLLQKKFGSTTRVDRARAELRNIKQDQSEGIRSYSTRFEGLLAKLPTFDQEWAKSQFIWGLHQKIAELVVISGPSDLRAAINQAENIEMARNQVAAGHQQQGQRSGGQWRGGRSGFSRGRGRFGAIQSGQQ